VKRIWRWLVEHLVWIKPEGAKQADVKGGAVGFKWKF
jgi:hypothetical protein